MTLLNDENCPEVPATSKKTGMEVAFEPLASVSLSPLGGGYVKSSLPYVTCKCTPVGQLGLTSPIGWPSATNFASPFASVAVSDPSGGLRISDMLPCLRCMYVAT